MIKRLLLSISLWSVMLSAFAAGDVFSDELAFCGGERATFYIYYNLGPIWLHAGDVLFTAKERKENGADVFDLRLAGNTIKSFDRFYTIRDTFSVTTRKDGLLPLRYKEAKHEDSYFCDKRYHFDWSQDGENAKVFMQFNVKGKMSYDTLDIQRGIMDLITTCYRFRSVDMSKVKKGQVIPFKLVFDNEIYDLSLKYSGEESIKLRNKKKYKALKFVPQLITGDIFEDENAMAIYVSNDENHVPLYIEAKIKVGYVKVMLNDVQNTKSPMTSLISK